MVLHGLINIVLSSDFLCSTVKFGVFNGVCLGVLGSIWLLVVVL